MGFLTEISDEVRRRLERQPLDESALMASALTMPPTRGFERALRAASPPAVIAEIKRASPSAGRIVGSDTVASTRARAYELAGAAAVSVLTEPVHFDGSIADLQAVHGSVDIPVLRKDFLLHPSQLIESRARGADAVLLIAAALSPSELGALVSAATDLGLDCLVETHSGADLDAALAIGATVIGVNARDLETLEVDPERALAMLGRVPGDRVTVLESGIASRADVERAAAAGATAVLVGEALMRARDPAAALRELRGAA
jgi:indole-3-glycerol phosphate synthase